MNCKTLDWGWTPDFSYNRRITYDDFVRAVQEHPRFRESIVGTVTRFNGPMDVQIGNSFDECDHYWLMSCLKKVETTGRPIPHSLTIRIVFEREKAWSGVIFEHGRIKPETSLALANMFGAWRSANT